MLSYTPLPTSPAKSVFAAAGALIAGLVATTGPMTKTLIVLMSLDLASGFLLAWSTRAVSSDASFRGMSKKAMILILVGAATAYNATQPLGFDAATAVAGFFATTEFISIIENAGRIGLPIPAPLVDALKKLGIPTPKEK